MRKKSLLEKAFSEGNGIFRLAPNWVPREFCVPGGRLKLAPEDLYALGKDRGGIDERWFSSTTKADNGPDTPEDEGLSYIVVEDNNKEKQILFKEAIEIIGDEILGENIMNEYGGWKMFSKFFDNQYPLPHHVHLKDNKAKNVDALGKPEGYYFPPQLNFTKGEFPYTFFGLKPGTSKEEVKECIRNFNQGDNGILNLAKAYKLQPGTGWLVPPGLLHAPGSLVTYEPQRASDVYSMFQSVVQGQTVPKELLLKDVPEKHKDDIDYIVDILDWEANVDPYLGQNRFLEPIPVKNKEEMKNEGYVEKWIVYGSEHFCAKELTIFPEEKVTIKDEAAYGTIVVQGRGTIEGLKLESPTMIHYGELTNDEFFVSIKAAQEGVEIENKSDKENIVMLKHFGPGHPEIPVNESFNV